MNDERIIRMYNDGYSIDYIAKVYLKYKNRNLRPIKANGVIIVPVKLYTKHDCLLYVHSTIYSYIINKDKIDAEICS